MDGLDWLRRQGAGCETTINRIMRTRVKADSNPG